MVCAIKCYKVLNNRWRNKHRCAICAVVCSATGACARCARACNIGAQCVQSGEKWRRHSVCTDPWCVAVGSVHNARRRAVWACTPCKLELCEVERNVPWCSVLALGTSARCPRARCASAKCASITICCNQIILDSKEVSMQVRYHCFSTCLEKLRFQNEPLVQSFRPLKWYSGPPARHRLLWSLDHMVPIS